MVVPIDNTKHGCLRFVSIVIAAVCTILELLYLAVSLLVVNTTSLLESDDDNFREVLLYRFLFFLFTFISCLKLCLSVVLIVGLHMRMPDHLEMWYRGYSLLECWSLALVIFVAVYMRKISYITFWLVIVGKLMSVGITLFFVIVIRYYYYQMKKEPNYYRDLSCRAYQKSSYYENPKETSKDDVLLYAAKTNGKILKEMSPGFKTGKTCAVFTTPESANV